jgi:hypothetical protein
MTLLIDILLGKFAKDCSGEIHERERSCLGAK